MKNNLECCIYNSIYMINLHELNFVEFQSHIGSLSGRETYG